MLDTELLRNHIHIVSKKLQTRGFFLNIKEFIRLENRRKFFQIKTENLQKDRKLLSKKIGNYKKTKKNIEELKNKVININKKLKINKKKLSYIKEKILKFCLSIPNIPCPDVPIGTSNSDNINVYDWGNQYKIRNTNKSAKNHVAIGNQLSGFDWVSSANMSGSRFVIMKNKVALLHRALGQFMLDLHTIHHGYSEIYVPYLVKSNCLYGTGQLPKFGNDLFHVYSTNQKTVQLSLIPTAEVPLTNLFRNKLIDQKKLPIMLTAHSPCFRLEAYSYGQDSKGLIRTHQFEKVEIVQIVHPKNSEEALEEISTHAEKVLQLLELPYRKSLLCTKDLGFSSAKTYDLEVWFPSVKKYREVSSCSNMLDFQSRRINIKYFSKTSKEKKFLHTLNASGLAVGRTLAAIIENYQNSNGKVEIPIVLQKKYMNGLKFID